MIILGLTGSIGHGKSTVASMFAHEGVPVFDADATVHRLLGKGGEAVPLIAEVFPDAVVDGAVDRRRLGAAVFDNPPALRQLEAIIHPLVHGRERRFLAECARRRVPLAVLDIPLLFETGGDRRCDYVAVVSAPEPVQTRRVLRREGMTPEKLASVRAQQIPDREKRRRADFVIPTGLNLAETRRRVRRLIRRLSSKSGLRWRDVSRYRRIGR